MTRACLSISISSIRFLLIPLLMVLWPSQNTLPAVTSQIIHMKHQPIPPKDSPIIFMDVFYAYKYTDLFNEQAAKSHRWWLPSPLQCPYMQLVNTSIHLSSRQLLTQLPPQPSNTSVHNTEEISILYTGPQGHKEHTDNPLTSNTHHTANPAENGLQDNHGEDSKDHLPPPILASYVDENSDVLSTDEKSDIPSTNEKSDFLSTDEKPDFLSTDEKSEVLSTDEKSEVLSRGGNSVQHKSLADLEKGQEVSSVSSAERAEGGKILLGEGSDNYVEVVLIDAASFEEFSAHPCCWKDDISSGDEACMVRSPSDTGDSVPPESLLQRARLPVNSNSIRFEVSSEVSSQSQNITETGAYFLLLVRCNPLSELTPPPPSATIDGLLKIRNAFGYLPGNLFKRMDFYYGLMITFSILLLTWIVTMAKQKHNLIPFHYFVGLILTLGLLHTSLKFSYYSSWNLTGYRSSFRLAFSILSYIALNGASFILILVASLGWGVTKPHLEKKTLRQIQVFIFIYIIVEATRVSISEIGTLNNASTWYIILLIIPSSITYFFLIFWIFNSLIGLLSELERNRQFEKLRIFKKLMICLLFAVATGTVIALIGNYIITMPVWKNWTVLWIFEDLTPFLIFMFVLTFVMFLWRPSQKSKRLAYFIELREADDFREIDKWSDSLSFEDSDDDLFTERHDKSFSNTVQPIIIGRSTQSSQKSRSETPISSPSIEMIPTVRIPVETKKY